MIKYALLLCVLVVAACGREQQAPDVSQPDRVEIDIVRYQTDVATLSSDAFGGRSPSSKGEQMTVDYLVDAFSKAGLVGGNAGSFVQEVPLVAITATDIEPLTVRGNDQTLTLATGSEAVVWTRRVVDQVQVSDSELVFVGYGTVAPEYDWDDYAGLDVAGKTVVMLVNDPGFATGDEQLFTGRRMTYYGRWTYKYEEAARQGATGVILIHETEAAGYPWGVVEGGWTGEQFGLEAADGNASRTVFESWITEAAATRLFAALGHDYSALLARAQRAGFEPVVLGGRVSTALTNTLARSKSKNVVALLPGEIEDETVGFSAHWDHLGTVDNGEEDGIFNGAIDNATGTAALLELARVLSGEPRRRSYLFIATTGEESGLLGSAWYAANPSVNLAKMAGLINIDAMNVSGATHDVTVVGFGSSTLESYLADAAARQQRRLEPESSPEKGFFFRSDHFNFAKQGVPVLYAESGIDHVEFGKEYGLQQAAEYTAQRYHKPSDEISEDWDYAGVEQDLNLYLDVARAIANSDEWPEWHAGNAFRERREASAEQRL